MSGFLPALWSFLRHPVVAAEERILAVESRVEAEARAAIRERLLTLEEQLAAVRARVVDDLKRELRHLIFTCGLAACAGMLALIGIIYLLIGAWLLLEEWLGGALGSLALAAGFLLLSLLPIIALYHAASRSHNRSRVGQSR